MTVSITPIYNGSIRTLAASKVSNNRFNVYGAPGLFHWTVFGKRLDIVVQPNKDEVDVKGSGPYTYI